VTYEIVRFYENPEEPNRVLKRGLTLKEAQEHCNDPETSYSTCTKPYAVRRTRLHGRWFDGYREEQ
jgi:hypothetical protein